MRKKILLPFLVMLMTGSVIAQDELAALSKEDNAKKEKIRSAFKSPRVIMGHSVGFLHPGTMDFRILHRFGTLDQGASNFFGLDQATMRLGFDFGILSNLMAGVGRSTYKKEIDGYIKYAPWQQTTDNSMPVTIALVAGMTINSMPWEHPERENFFSSRLAYYYQVLVGRKFNNKFSFQLSPTLVHNNLAASGFDNDIYALGFGGRYKLSNRIAVTLDYYHNFNGIQDDFNYDPLSVGVDIETGGHVFQLHFTNATGMNERAFINDTYGGWGKGEVRYGFNLSRVFQINGNKTKDKKAW